MNKITCWLSVAVVAALLAVTPAVRAQEPERRLAERLERLEQQVQRMAAMQERSMERLGRPEEPRGPLPLRSMIEGPKAPMPVPTPACPMKSPGAAHCLRGVGHALILVLVILHITLAVWVYGDVQKRGVSGRGVFIVLVLLAGIPMSILYALVRIGDRCCEKQS